nr:anaerobic ribonucleoside reductase large subunit [uncultured phage]CAI9752312.1 anaerobic ribonucleoside reductase large subunit [uncultured phage]
MSKIPISLDEDFEQEFQNFKRNHNYSYIKLSGLQPKQLDVAGYIRDFCEANNQADNSIDGTSNSASKDIVALENDISKPMFKMVALNKIFTKLAEKYGSDVANDWLDSELSGKSYLHDAHSSTFIPYCYAYDLTKLANEGLFFLSHTAGIPYYSQPAKHLDTFVNHVKEYVSFCCNRQAGVTI